MEVTPQEQDSNRNPDGTFKEGVSGNPSGRPHGISIKSKILLHLKNNPDILDKLVKHYLETESDTMRKLLWEMIDGKPTQALASDPDNPLKIHVTGIIINQPTNEGA